jgi:hypothetical protein
MGNEKEKQPKRTRKPQKPAGGKRDELSEKDLDKASGGTGHTKLKTDRS